MVTQDGEACDAAYVEMGVSFRVIGKGFGLMWV